MLFFLLCNFTVWPLCKLSCPPQPPPPRRDALSPLQGSYRTHNSSAHYKYIISSGEGGLFLTLSLHGMNMHSGFLTQMFSVLLVVALFANIHGSRKSKNINYTDASPNIWLAEIVTQIQIITVTVIFYHQQSAKNIVAELQSFHFLTVMLHSSSQIQLTLIHHCKTPPWESLCDLCLSSFSLFCWCFPWFFSPLIRLFVFVLPSPFCFSADLFCSLVDFRGEIRAQRRQIELEGR